MSLEGIREAYQQIQEQGGSYRGAGRAAFRDLNRKPIPTAPKAPMSAAGALGTTGDALGARDPGRDPVPAPAPRTGINPNRAFSGRGAGRAAFRDSNIPANSGIKQSGGGLNQGEKPKPAPTTPTTPSSLSDAGTGSGSSSSPTPPKDNMAGASKEARMAAFAKANPQLAIAAAEKARTRGTAQSDNPLLNRMKLRSGMRAGTPTVQDPKVQSLGKGNQSLKNNRYAGRSPLMNDNRDAYDMVLDYLLSEGHAETVEEAHYIMMQLDQEHIQEVVEAYVVTNADKMGNTKAYQNYKAGMKNKVTGKPLYVAAPHLKGV
tara:strand:- start:82 stop:1035 length:954 start_codon:yes stop_codon:yes gene_type:complete